MEELVGLCIGAVVCVLPVVGIWVLATMSRRQKDLEARLGHYEESFASLGSQIVRLHQRIQTLETQPAALPPGTPAAVDGPAIVGQGAPAAAMLAVESAAVAQTAVTPQATPWPVQHPAPNPEAQSPVVHHAMAQGPAPTVPAQNTAQEVVAQEMAATGLPANPSVGASASRWAAGTAEPQEPSVPAAVTAAGESPNATLPSQAGGFGGTGGFGGGVDGQGDGEPPSSAPTKIAWEEWIGVRGAAALGALVLLLAGLYFFQYSIEHGWLGPVARFSIGVVTGLSLVGVAQLRLMPRYRVAATWLTGAGFSILYFASWAGVALYNLYPTWAAAIFMIAVTGACVAMALRRKALAIALLGLAGGFVTPIALSTGQDRPLPLFSYLLVLDLAVLYVAWRRRWFALAAFAFIGTFLYEAGWLFARMRTDTLWIGALVLCVFAVLFAFVPLSNAKDEESKNGEWLRPLALLLPVGLLVMLGMTTDLVKQLPILGAQLAVLSIAGAVLSQKIGNRTIGALVGLGVQAVLVGTLLAHPISSPSTGWWMVLVAALPMMVFLLGTEILVPKAFGGGEPPESASGGNQEHVSAGAVGALLGGLVLGMVLCASEPSVSYAAGVLMALPSAIAIRLVARFPRWNAVPLVTLTVGGIGIAFLFVARSTLGAPTGTFGFFSGPTPASMFRIGLLLLAAVAPHVGGVLLRRKTPVAARLVDHGTALVATVFLFALAASGIFGAHHLLPLYGGGVVLVLSLVFAAGRLGLGGWLLIGAVVVALCGAALEDSTRAHPGMLFSALSMQVVLLLGAPVFLRRLGENPWAWRGAGMAPLLALFPLRQAYVATFGTTAQGLLPVMIAVVCLGALMVVRLQGRRRAVPLPSGAQVWLVGAAAALLTVAIPMQLEKQWLTIGWALEVLVFAWLWRRFDHPGAKYSAFLLALVVLVRLVFNPFVLDYEFRSTLRVINWLSYTYLVPAAALFAAHALMRPLEAARRRKWEPALGEAPVANVLGIGGIALIFAWLNLMVFDFFADGTQLTIPSEHMAARDLTLSMVWAVYAAVILAVGVWRRSTGLRWASLALLLLTCAKVFLYDLGHLEELYRVAALVGLAFTLIGISLAYKRFVFTDSDDQESP